MSLMQYANAQSNGTVLVKDALDATFKDDKALYEYDSFHKMYKVNHLLMMNP